MMGNSGTGHQRRSTDATNAQTTGMFEPLEQRTLLYTPTLLQGLPPISALADPENTVIRMATDFGHIDIELFDRAGPDGLAENAAPITAGNFLEYINSGRLGTTFFHRLVENFVLQGGGFGFDDDSGLFEVPENDPIQNEFDPDRPNVARTIAMALRGADDNSATSQFFINLVDNPGLDVNGPTGGGPFTVFGRVIQGWNIVQTIAGFATADYSDVHPALGGPQGGVPVAPAAGTNPEIGSAALVDIIDVQVIKPAGADEFYSEVLYSPEGFNSNKIMELIDLANLDANEATEYQIIVRYAGDYPRDTVVANGTLAPGARTNLTISDIDPELDLVRNFVAYAFEIRSTGPLAATLNRFDFGSATSEAFVNVSPLDFDDLITWSFGGGHKGEGVHPFLVWQNLSLQPAQLTITFHHQQTGSAITLNRTVDALRRGGFDLGQLPLPAGDFSVIITSTEPITAAYSEYTETTTADGGFMANGSYTSGAYGILPGAYLATGGGAVIRAEMTDTPVGFVIVDFDFIFSDGTVITSTNPLSFSASSPARSRLYDVLARNPDLPRDEFFTIRYRSRNPAVPFTMHYVTEAAGGQASTPFITAATGSAAFAGGFFDPTAGAGFDEVISIMNPFGNEELTYRVGFLFADNENGIADELFFPAAAQGTLDALGRVDIRISDLSDVLAKIQSDERFRQFSIFIETTNADGDPSIAVTQLTRLDPGSDNAITTIGQLGNGTLTAIPSGLILT